MQDDHPLTDDVWAMRGKLAEVVEAAGAVAGHLLDWQRLGIADHIPAEVTVVRLEALHDALWDLVKAALDARLACQCVKARVEQVKA
jgi:hypothetical protein